MSPNFKSREAYLLRTYGITLKDFNLLRRRQKYKCPICLRHEKEFGSFVVDHIHTGPFKNRIRGLLCPYDNHRVVGRHTDGEKMQRVADYLRQGTEFYAPERKKRKSRRT